MLLIIGLDGATWDLLDPWIERGCLPNLGRIRRHGTWGPLQVDHAARHPSELDDLHDRDESRPAWDLRLHAARAGYLPRAVRQRELSEVKDHLETAE